MTKWRWTYANSPSDLSVPGANFDKDMLLSEPATGEVTVDVAFDSTEVDYFFSEYGTPGAPYWPAGTATVKVDITQANTKVKVRPSLQRVSKDGTWRQAYGFYQLGVLCTAGVKTLSFVVSAQAAEKGDRLRLGLEWVRDNSFGGNGIVKFGFGDPVIDYTEVPIIMANPQLEWDSNTLVFPHPLSDFDERPSARRVVTMSDGVVSRTAIRNITWSPRLKLERFSDADFEAALHAWWAWVSQGNTYAFALDGSETANTTLDGTAAAAQKVIPLTSTTGITAGLKYLIREANGLNYELVHVDSISAGVSVTARDNLKFGYASGDIFRSRNYYPQLVSADTRYPVVEEVGGLWTLDHQTMEDRG